jgi:hypothetical protein
MYNLHDKMEEFHKEKVKLPESEKSRLRGFKAINITRLKNGISEINEEKNKTYTIVDDREQGSVAMSTLVQNDYNDFDIDVAVIFDKEGLLSSAYDTRKMVEDALRRKCTGFKKEPTARTNAVTVWYQEGYHIDFAIYRRSKDAFENFVYEHAGAEWTKRNPSDITDWFNKQVNEKSPKKENGAKVENGQMRRMVRLLKMFCRSRSSWSLPGGLILSKLVDECYVPNPERDDKAFYDTIKAIHDRLLLYVDVYNPVDSSQSLTSKEKHKNKVRRLRDRLGEKLSCLDVLFKDDCTEEKAMKAWKDFFNHDFWKVEVTQESVSMEKTFSNRQVVYPYHLDVTVDVYDIIGNKPKFLYRYQEGDYLPKGLTLLFKINHRIPAPYEVHWKVVNRGDEAIDAGDISHKVVDMENIHMERTLYKGCHDMNVSIKRDGTVLARRTIQICIL